MLKGISVNERVELVSEFDDSEPKTIFVIRPLNGEERQNFLNPADDKIHLVGTRLYDFLEIAVVEIRNYDLGTTVREKLVSLKDDRVITWLIKEAGKLNNMTEQDAKN